MNSSSARSDGKACGFFPVVRLAVRMLLGDRVRFYSLVASLTVALLLLENLFAIFCGVMYSFTNLPAASEAPIWIKDKLTPMYDLPSPMPNNSLGSIRSIPGVAWAEPYYRAYTYMKLPGGNMTEVSLISVADVSLAGLPHQFLKGNAAELNRPDAIALDCNEPDILGNPDIGSEFELNDFRVVVRAMVDMKPNSMGNPVVFMTESNFLRKVPRSRKSMSFVLAAPAPGKKAADVCAEINRCCPNLLAMTQADFMRETAIWYIDNTFFPQIFLLIAAIGLLLAIVITAQQLYTFVIANIAEFAALKALGYTNTALRRMLSVQSITAGFFACGFGFGILALEGISFAQIPGMMFYLPIELMMSGVVLLLLVCLLSGAGAMWKICRIEPAEVFRK